MNTSSHPSRETLVQMVKWTPLRLLPGKPWNRGLNEHLPASFQGNQWMGMSRIIPGLSRGFSQLQFCNLMNIVRSHSEGKPKLSYQINTTRMTNAHLLFCAHCVWLDWPAFGPAMQNRSSITTSTGAVYILFHGIFSISVPTIDTHPYYTYTYHDTHTTHMHHTYTYHDDPVGLISALDLVDRQIFCHSSDFTEDQALITISWRCTDN